MIRLKIDSYANVKKNYVLSAHANKKAVLSQDAPYIWVPWKFLNGH